MKTFIVQLDIHDDVISTRDKISWSKAHRVLLVWPRKGKILERRLDLIVIQRYCQQIGVQLALVTRSSQVKDNARDLGIPVFKQTFLAQASAWRRPNKRKIFRFISNRKPIPAQELRTLHNSFKGFSSLSLWTRLSVFMIGMLAFLSLVFFFMPGASIQLSPSRRDQRLSISVWANSTIQTPNLSGGIPAYPISVMVEGRDQTASTGITFIPDQYARGEVEITNLTEQPVEIAAGSVVLTVGNHPIRFVTTRAVYINAGANEKALVPIRAVSPGNEGNVQAGNIIAMEGLVGLQVIVNNPEPTRGGSVRTIPAPSAQDYNQLKARLLDQTQLTALEELQAQILPGQRLLYQSIQMKRVVSEERNPAIDQPADQLQLTLQVEYQAWMVKESDLMVVAQTALDANLPPGFEPVMDSLDLSYVHEPILDPAGNARWDIHVERMIEAAYSKDRVIQLVLGKLPEEAEATLQSTLSLGSPVKIDLFPAWWVRLPFLPFRIEVIKS